MTTPSVPAIPYLAERLRAALALNEQAEAEPDMHYAMGLYARLHVNLRSALPEIISALEELSRLKAGEGWQPIETAPKDGTPILAWCPIVFGLGDSDATPDGEWRVVWWEARGQWTSDRDLGNETFTEWRPLPSPPGDR